MRINKMTALKLVVALAITFGFTACSKKSGGSNTSTATGWRINDKKGGFQHNSRYKQQEPGPGLVEVEGGTFTMGRVSDDVMHDWNNTPTQQHVQSFYMDETEVTNVMYMEYLDWLKRVYPPSEENYKNIYVGALPDTLVWRSALGYNETMTNNYLRHPAYGNYPVVGVNWIQAVEFSKWRTDRVNEALLEQEGYIKRDAKITDVSAESTFSTEAYLESPSKSYGGNEEIVYKGRNNKLAGDEEAKGVYAQRTSGLILPEYRLPTEAEWEYAAIALVGNREYNLYRGNKKYPWKGQYTRNSRRQSKGDQLANFKQGKGDYGGIAGWSDDNADITAPVKSYPPNDFGLYDMAGNVAEWVADVYRPIVDDEANDFNYYRGNVYMKNKIGDDGRAELVTAETIEYDTLANGRIQYRNLPGQIAQEAITQEDVFLRQNYTRSDNRDYRDGDVQSSRFYNYGATDEGGLSENQRMYDAPKHEVGSDSLGEMYKKWDPSSTRTTLINDNVRVYKGGSWRDRAYWLDPAQRRYFPQDMATDYIGFRCAMSKVGPKNGRKTARN
ncbi:gliding motility lipoprotein GldJ [Flavobacterium coralii]|uniref:gliding motility lipoprotein GldJ n=1 Tax=Flavobacterium coralii TaxID=2838017 RepID=UPI000C3F8E32|nr:gliding motility lipoprotein GldJ [Flavobacterium coralii]MBF00139.1 gliding motility lipoprotein GldJ [Flavobacterium sp.]MBY8962864.1 gliding motility lipoprotein GldJ [Flavobacterium coralii]|tara:strand:- start:389 stop:2056 length:1668 start_codon:yes stop_codon:yes gene_type:complete